MKDKIKDLFRKLFKKNKSPYNFNINFSNDNEAFEKFMEILKNTLLSSNTEIEGYKKNIVTDEKNGVTNITISYEKIN